jgi:CBS domain-containing protein
LCDLQRDAAGEPPQNESIEMSVRSILKAKGSTVVTTTPEASVKSAADEMHRRNIAALIVVSGEEILGVVSEREIVTAFSLHGEKLSQMTVGQVMRKDVYTLAPDDHVTRAMALMTQHRVRHLPVVEADRLAGVVSIGDAVKNRLDDLEVETRVLRDISIAVR